ncbi:OmpA family protein [Marinomonas transparens]|uniref:OmpA family protein n=1 Tax=Marinomonas transparens TaxID=2795388 RepID=A0A934JQL2_9GAMM|nr:OmpA family protein [Marinomonas transparens]MBJ7538259.1 OmpA family protein [Marinomonas transparens]
MKTLAYCLILGSAVMMTSGCQHNVIPKPVYPYDIKQVETNRVADALRIASVRIAQLNRVGGAECIPARLYRMQQLARKIRGEHESGLDQDALLNLRILDQHIRDAEDGLAYLQINTACQQYVQDLRLVALQPLLKQIAEQTFTTGQANLPAGMSLLLDDLAKWLLAHPAYQVSLVGHTDAMGEAHKNENLALERAFTLSNYLKAQHVPDYQIAINAQGELNPISSNASESMRYKNRRVEATAILLIPSQKLESKVKEWPSVTDIWRGK